MFSLKFAFLNQVANYGCTFRTDSDSEVTIPCKISGSSVILKISYFRDGRKLEIRSSPVGK